MRSVALEGSVSTGVGHIGDIVATRHGDVEESEKHVGCRGRRQVVAADVAS